MDQRKHPRVFVNLPVSLKFIGNGQTGSVLSQGKVDDLSMGGMKVSLPLSEEPAHGKLINYLLNLPEPFQQLAGRGKIRWVTWDEQQNRLVVGLEFGDLDETQRHDLEMIVKELDEDAQE